MRFPYLVIVLSLLIFVGCSDDDNPGGAKVADQLLITFSETDLSLQAGNGEYLSIIGDGFSDEVFAASFHLLLSDTSLVTIDTDQTVAGSLFGTDAIVFTRLDGNLLRITATRIQGDSSYEMEGEMASIYLEAEEAGEATVSFVSGTMEIYNEAGILIDMDVVGLEDISVTITQ